MAGHIIRVVPTLKVVNLDASLAFYAMLGFAIDFRYEATPTGPYYAGISRDGHEIHLSTHAGDGVFGTAVYCYVDDIDALFRELIARGLTVPGKPDSPVEDSPVDQTWGMREFYVRDPDGNTLRFGTPVS
jgi:catechol 2,3-dioxygenase-like lactoylglutathione lyase family enzyme